MHGSILAVEKKLEVSSGVHLASTPTKIHIHNDLSNNRAFGAVISSSQTSEVKDEGDGKSNHQDLD